MKEELVSIIMPLYNCQEFVTQSINSVLKQTYENWELLIVDDKSTDNSALIVEKLLEKEKRLHLVKLQKNEGSARARNMGIEKAKGRYIAFLDSDDYWKPEKLKKQIFFMTEKEAALSFTAFKREYMKGRNRVFRVSEKVSYLSTLIKNPICNSSVIIDSNKIGKVYFPDIRKRQDYGLWLDILKTKTKFGYGLDEVLTMRVVRDGSVSSNKIKLIKYNWILYREIQKIPFVFCVILILLDIASKIFRVK